MSDFQSPNVRICPANIRDKVKDWGSPPEMRAIFDPAVDQLKPWKFFSVREIVSHGLLNRTIARGIDVCILTINNKLYVCALEGEPPAIEQFLNRTALRNAVSNH